MLNEDERRLIRKYCIRPKIAITAMIMAMAIGAVWIVLIMIDDLVFESKSFYGIGLFVYLAIVVVYVILFCYWFLSVKIGMKKKPWLDIVYKVSAYQSNRDYSAQISGAMGMSAAGRILDCSDNETLQNIGEGMTVVGAVGTVATIAQMGNESLSNAKSVARACRMEIPKVKKYILSLIFIPIFLLIAVYIPEYINSNRITENEKRVAAESVYTLQSVFEKECAYVSIDDPNEEYQDYGYSVRGYLYDFDDVNKSYITVEVGNDGVINRVLYYVNVDIQAGKEENLKRAEIDLKRLNNILNQAGVKASTPELTKQCKLSKGFKEQFVNASYYEEINMREDSDERYKTYLSYVTETEEEYDEYSSSYIYLSVESK